MNNYLFTRCTFEEGKEQKSREVDKAKAAPLCRERVGELVLFFPLSWESLIFLLSTKAGEKKKA
jgi:hypothetical protein